ncbi:unnamed protein product [Notodromas monacha]|uniref:Uncharacterized protein n=1 Tax=Notodromas monacha TaxID=399045 RepID=A0A7R9GFY7_9CRUS|nr:unnamed protein product [Notodromas monacha]CAG0919823.1 unnamed protein product [Notodromas monacha]
MKSSTKLCSQHKSDAHEVLSKTLKCFPSILGITELLPFARQDTLTLTMGSAFACVSRDSILEEGRAVRMKLSEECNFGRGLQSKRRKNGYTAVLLRPAPLVGRAKIVEMNPVGFRGGPTGISLPFVRRTCLSRPMYPFPGPQYPASMLTPDFPQMAW